MKKKTLTTRLPEGLIKAVKFLSVETGRPVSSLLQEALEDLLRKYGRPVPEEGEDFGEKI